VIFISPKEQDFLIIRSIFNAFGGASGLTCNIAKTQMVPIKCDEEEKNLASNLFPCQATDFPVRYLRIPLSTHKLSRTTYQPLMDRMSDRLPT
jgi:hypothetical protein